MKKRRSSETIDFKDVTIDCGRNFNLNALILWYNVMALDI